MRLSGLAASLAVTLAVTGCSGLQPSSEGSEDLALGWARVDSGQVALPDAAPFVGNVADVDADKPVLINFWGSFCGPCKQELPILEKASQENAVEVVGVTRDQLESYAQSALDAAHVTYPNWMDEDASYSEQFAGVIPTNALPMSAQVVDGHVVAVHIGPFKSLTELTSRLPDLTASVDSD